MWDTLPARDVPVLNVAFVGSEDLARSLAKSNDVRDIESYVHKEERGGEVCVISLLRPLKHPEKIRPLLSVLNVAEVSGIRNGIAIINPSEGEWVDLDQVRTILLQAGLEGWFVHESLPEVHDLREELFQRLDNMVGEGKGGALILPVDQHFNVKGVGLVAIGYVQTGSVNKHDEVLILPANEKGVVRSLQVMDDDVDVAKVGDRVGVALRNLREEALHRGCMITHPDSEVMVRHDKSSLEIRTAPFQKRSLQVDDVIHAAVDLQFVVGRVTHVEGTELGVDWDSPLWVRKENLPSILITQLDAMPMRVIGVIDSIRQG